MHRRLSSKEKLFIETDKIFTSYHEAGHTICALFHLMKVDFCYIKHDTRYIGFTSYNYTPFDQIKNQLAKIAVIKRHIEICYSGQLAEKILYKKLSGSDVYPKALQNGSSFDYEEARGLIDQFSLAEPGNKRIRFKKKMLKATSKILNSYWEDVVLVAHELCRNKKVTFSDLSQMLCYKSSNQDIWRQKIKLINELYSDNLVDVTEILKNNS
jgi:hypothetical protein